MEEKKVVDIAMVLQNVMLLYIKLPCNSYLLRISGRDVFLLLLFFWERFGKC